MKTFTLPALLLSVLLAPTLLLAQQPGALEAGYQLPPRVIVDILDAASFFSTGLYDHGFYNQPPGASLSAGFGGPLVAAVPEPSAWFTLVAACAAALASRRRTARGTAGGGSSWGGCRPGPRFRRRDARARSAAPVRSR